MRVGRSESARNDLLVRWCVQAIPRHIYDLFAMYAEEMITLTSLSLDDLNEA